MTPPAEDRALISAGQQLSNVAYNLAQSPAIPQRDRETLDACRKDWDAALPSAPRPAPDLLVKRP